MKAFRDPKDSIGTLDPATAATLVTVASDVALVMDGDGVIQDMAFQQSDLSLELEGYGRWFGRPWRETVSAESQAKVETMLREASAESPSVWRQVTHQTLQGVDVPILYSAVKLNGGNRIIALGRDLRAVAALQQRLVDAQMSMERDYAKLRFAETRYRLLFQTSNEPVIIVDAGTHKILEANPAATALLDSSTKRVIGRSFTDIFAPASRTAVQGFLADLRSGSRVDDIVTTLTDGRGSFNASAAMFRQEGASLLLVRLSPTSPALAPARNAWTEGERRLTDFIGAAPDAFVLVDASGRIIAANRAFKDMTQLAEDAQLQGASLDQWLGRSGVDFDVMMSNLRQHGLVRLFATVVRGEQGTTLDVETSAVTVGEGKTATYGFSIRDVGRRLTGSSRTGYDLPHSAEQLTELIGRVPLKDLVRETTDVIEKLCIEAALELTGDNRASAAEVLGLSRQSLYVKLRRFGFDTGADDT